MSNVTSILDKTTTAKLTKMITEKIKHRKNRAPDLHCNFEERTSLFERLVQRNQDVKKKEQLSIILF